MSKNFKTKDGVQKYICNSCEYTCLENIDTMVSHSRLLSDVWSNVYIVY